MDDQVRRLLPNVREPDVLVWLPGPPRGKGSPRALVMKHGKMAGKAMITSDPKTRSYEGQIAYMGQLAMREALLGAPLDCSLRCRVTAVFQIPKSMSKRDREHALAGYIRPSVKPDDDNILKCRDALKGIVFRDDSLFVESVVRKFYGENPGWQFECWKWSGLML